MTIKKNMEAEVDTRWRSKGGAHRATYPAPTVCSDCGGSGVHVSENGEDFECPKCQGIGEIWE